MPTLACALAALSVWLWLGARDRIGEAPARAPGPAEDCTVLRPPVRARAVDIADIAEMLALVLSSGAGVNEALDLVGSQTPGVLGAHCRSVAAAGRWGMDEEAQWSAVPGGWLPVRRAMDVAARAGVPPSEALLAAAADIRRAEQHRLDVATSKLGAKVVLPLGLAFLPAFALTTVVPVVLGLGVDILTG